MSVTRKVILVCSLIDVASSESWKVKCLHHQKQSKISNHDDDSTLV